MGLRDVSWLPTPNIVNLRPSHDQSGRYGPCTAAFVIANYGRTLLLVDHSTRGPDLPGGHVETGEGPADTAVRELAEETGIHLDTGRLAPAGMIACRVYAPRPSGYRYPLPDSHLRLYGATLTDNDLYAATVVHPDDERSGRLFADLGETQRRSPDAVWLPLAAHWVHTAPSTGATRCR